ncbi:hypothetical protein [Actinophytocola sediminis]
MQVRGDLRALRDSKWPSAVLPVSKAAVAGLVAAAPGVRVTSGRGSG